MQTKNLSTFIELSACPARHMVDLGTGSQWNIDYSVEGNV